MDNFNILEHTSLNLELSLIRSLSLNSIFVILPITLSFYYNNGFVMSLVFKNLKLF